MKLAELEEYKDKLDSLTQRTKGCWWFTGNNSSKGRRQISIKGKWKRAVTMAWELANKEELPEGMVVKQSCMNSDCINPEHLELARRTYGWLS